MKRRRRFPVAARLDMVSRVVPGTVVVDPRPTPTTPFGTFSVRPHRRRREYVLPLETVADMVVGRVVRAEVFKARLEKAERRRKKTP